MLQSGCARTTGIRPGTLLTISLILLLEAVCQAQLYTGSVTGVVQDPTGAVLALWKAKPKSA